MEPTQLLRSPKQELLKKISASVSNTAVFKWFLALTEVHRPSGDLASASKTITEWFTKLGAIADRDSYGNMIFRVPASKGKEKSPSICMQGHLDIVAVGDFDETGAVKLKLDNGWLTSGVSSIGGDDGIAIATMLAFCETKDSFTHGPLEFLVTLDEEIGLLGANHLAGPPFIQSRSLLNLDAEEWTSFYTSSAGSVTINFRYSVKRKLFLGRALKVSVSNFMSGHTGIVIEKQRSNAVHWLTRLLLQAKAKGVDFRLVSIEAGEKHNAIPASATAVIVVQGEDFESIIKNEHEVACVENKTIEAKGPKLEIIASHDLLHDILPMSRADTMKCINLITSIYHGVWRFHPDIDDLVQTSQSLSIVKMENQDVLYCQVYARTNEQTQIEWLINHNKALGELAGVSVNVPKSEINNPWPAALSSRVLDVAKTVYKRLFNSDPTIKGIHAGLECSSIQDRGYHDMECLSYGPTIENPHTTEERMDIKTADDFYALTLEIVKEWAK